MSVQLVSHTMDFAATSTLYTSSNHQSKFRWFAVPDDSGWLAREDTDVLIQGNACGPHGMWNTVEHSKVTGSFLNCHGLFMPFEQWQPELPLTRGLQFSSNVYEDSSGQAAVLFGAFAYRIFVAADWNLWLDVWVSGLIDGQPYGATASTQLAIRFDGKSKPNGYRFTSRSYGCDSAYDTLTFIASSTEVQPTEMQVRPLVYPHLRSVLKKGTSLISDGLVGNKDISFVTTIHLRGPAIYLSEREFLNDINRESRAFAYDMRRILNKRLSALHATAFDSLQKFDGNFFLLLSKLPAIGTVSVQSVLDFARSGMSMKDAASLFLATRYGDRLSISGLASLIESVNSAFAFLPTRGTVSCLMGKSRLFVNNPDWDCEAKLVTQIAVNPRDYNSLMKTVRTLLEWDAWPTLQNVWDAIPLSFVIDWFVNVGDIYASIDRLVATRYYDILGCLNSVKAECVSPTFLSLRHSYYTRNFTSQAKLGVSSVELGLPSAINVIAGAALICGFA